MSERSNLRVVDASIALKWLLPLDDEPFADLARAVFTDAAAGQIELAAPDHIGYEVGHSLRRAVRRERISELQGLHLLERFHAWQLATIPQTQLYRRAWEYSRVYGCSFYDGTYLAASDLTRAQFIHADDRLRAMVDGRFGREVWIEDYRSVQATETSDDH
jgi:predicted nucleic acid-binding protein